MFSRAFALLRGRRRAVDGGRRRARLVAGGCALVVLAACGGQGSSSDGSSERQRSTQEQATEAATWLAGQLDGGVVKGSYGPDWGLTIDVLFALEAADPASDSAEDDLESASRQIVAAFKKSPDSYFSAKAYEPKGGEKVRTSGAVAKSLVAVESADADPRAFGGFDLVKETTKLIASDGAEKGRLKDFDPVKHADYSNLFGQAYAVMGLAEADAPSKAALGFLLKQQCSKGYFRLEYNDSGSNPDLTCDGAKPKNAVASVDATALALAAMVVARDEGAGDLDEPIDDAATWLVQSQGDDGSFVDTVPGGTPNANSTGLAARALAAAGESDAADAASQWLASLQVTDDTGGALADQVGAVAKTAKALSKAKKSGLKKPDVLDAWRRATAPATLGLAQDGVF